MGLIEYGTKTAYPGIGVANARGSYVNYQYAAGIGNLAGLVLENIGRRQWNTAVIVTLEFQGLVSNRVWLGLFNGNPHLFGGVAADDANPTTVSGFGLRYSADVDISPTKFRSWSCDGLGVSTVKVLDGTAPLGNFDPTLSVTHRIMLRHVAGSGGKFQAWLQLGSDDGTASDGIWYLIAEHDANLGEFVPAAATDLSLWIVSGSLSGSGTRSIRIKSVAASQL